MCGQSSVIEHIFFPCFYFFDCEFSKICTFRIRQNNARAANPLVCNDMHDCFCTEALPYQLILSSAVVFIINFLIDQIEVQSIVAAKFIEKRDTSFEHSFNSCVETIL